ncbi:MAG: SxtJ family membrane protein [Terriglobia bacterium]
MNKEDSKKQLRSFGFLVGGVFVLLAIWPAMFRGQPARLWAMVVSACLLLPALLRPGILRPVFRVWMTLGDLLGWVNSRIVLGFLYFLVFTPAGLILRALGKDSLHLRIDRETASYRIVRTPRPASHMKQQF